MAEAHPFQRPTLKPSRQSHAANESDRGSANQRALRPRPRRQEGGCRSGWSTGFVRCAVRGPERNSRERKPRGRGARYARLSRCGSESESEAGSEGGAKSVGGTLSLREGRSGRKKERREGEGEGGGGRASSGTSGGRRGRPSPRPRGRRWTRAACETCARGRGGRWASVGVRDDNGGGERGESKGTHQTSPSPAPFEYAYAYTRSSFSNRSTTSLMYPLISLWSVQGMNDDESSTQANSETQIGLLYLV